MCLCTVVEARIHVCDKADSCRLPFRFTPLMVSNKEVVFFHEVFDAWKGLDLTHWFVGLNAMKDVICRIAFIVASDGFLMEFELFLMDFWIGPLDRANGFDSFVMIVDKNDVISHGFLDSLHPVSMDNTWSNAVLG